MVNIDDVATLLGRALTSSEEDRATRLIEIGEAQLAAALPGFTVTPGTEEVTLANTGPLWTPRYPVTAINALSVGGSEVDADLYVFDVKGRITAAQSGLVNDFAWNLSWPSWSTWTVDYDYGLDPVPADIAGVIAAGVAAVLRRQATNAGGVLNETIGSYSVGYGASEQQALAGGLVLGDFPSYWRRNVTSVQLERA